MKVNGRPALLVNLELDSGADNAFLLNSPRVKKERLLPAFKDTIQSTANGVGGEQQRVIVPFSSVKFGSIFIDRPLVALSLDTTGAGAGTNNDGTIGGEVLRRFRVIIDYSRRRMILERNKAFNEP